jgi:hypothetical protein
MWLCPEREAVFPNLQREDYRVTSKEDWVYNCIAHAAGRDDMPWWPVEAGTEGVFWPDGVVRECTLEAFISAYATIDYIPCGGPEIEEGFEKIAIYVDEKGEPTHAAKQLPNGRWSSKLGDWEDIEHGTLESLEGKGAYGRVAQIMKRRIRSGIENREEATA